MLLFLVPSVVFLILAAIHYSDALTSIRAHLPEFERDDFVLRWELSQIVKRPEIPESVKTSYSQWGRYSLLFGVCFAGVLFAAAGPWLSVAWLLLVALAIAVEHRGLFARNGKL